ncbi:MAG: phosphate signaling complex protein PhoU [Spirochaetaceae bacterium]|nr:phosphate signaling complex protein PhoU [Myxococcales bacterium]MCA9604007.1 phosphate signaling complex protein PhoU [Myxococcales bacterium]MCB9723664.1 phosphate signaling complex protein PhoU [Spirochaetaceae bacterium]
MGTTQSIKTGREIEGLRQTVLRMGGLCEAILAKSLRAAWARDERLSEEVARDDLEIDRLDVEVDAAVLRVLALRAPVAADLRQVLAIKNLATDLERVGDLARNIASSAHRLSHRDPVTPPPRLRSLAEDAQRSLARAMQSFADLDARQARAVIAEDEDIDALEGTVIREAIARIREEPSLSEQEIDLIFIAKSLERIADHATNIAEEVVLAAEALNLKHAEKLSR